MRKLAPVACRPDSAARPPRADPRKSARRLPSASGGHILTAAWTGIGMRGGVTGRIADELMRALGTGRSVGRFPGLGMAEAYAVAAEMLLGMYRAWRLLDEEKILQRDLPGYTQYMRRVRFRLVPFVW